MTMRRLLALAAAVFILSANVQTVVYASSTNIATPSSPDRAGVELPDVDTFVQTYLNESSILSPENFGGPVTQDGIESYISMSPGNLNASWYFYAIYITPSTGATAVAQGYYDTSKKYFYANIPSGTYLAAIRLLIGQSLLPGAGTYTTTVRMTDMHLAISQAVYSASFQFVYGRSNIEPLYAPFKNIPTSYIFHDSSSGRVGFQDVPIIYQNSPIQMMVNFNVDYNNYKFTQLQLSGFGAFFSFSNNSTDGITSTSDRVVPPSSSDIQQSISDSVGQIPGELSQMSGQLDNIGNTLQEIVTTISNQLNALWNQLYNYIHVPHMAKLDECTTKIVDAIENIDVEFTDYSQKIIANDNKIAQEAEQAEQQRHDNLVNGYDTSKGNQLNNDLQNALTGYEQEEQELLDDVQGNIKKFVFPTFNDNVLNPIKDVASFLTVLYNGAGDFQQVILFSLTLTIALMCIGWYRFRGA